MIFLFLLPGNLNPTVIGQGREDSFRNMPPSVSACFWHYICLSFSVILLHNEGRRRYCCLCVPCLLRKLSKNFCCIDSSSPIWLPCLFSNRQNWKPQAAVSLRGLLAAQPGGRPGSCCWSLSPPPVPDAPQLFLCLGIGLRLRAMWEGTESMPGSHEAEGAWTHLLSQVLAPMPMVCSAQEAVSSC